ncbi:hypothetical protein PINS_up006322 [Pythium insidiosum]|nr:hypothetical protein PINS_up006322 [Pythium insidiosum]
MAKVNATMVKDTLSKTTNLSAVEATTQLRVLCRKFAALTEKVKDETRIREDAEREVRRLKALLEASTRSEAQALIKDLKEAQERLKQELRQEKEKNALLVSRALELEKEKNALLSSASVTTFSATRMTAGAADMNKRHWFLLTPHNGPPESSQSRISSAWDREQSQKIHTTLTTTINELQAELTQKEVRVGGVSALTHLILTLRFASRMRSSRGVTVCNVNEPTSSHLSRIYGTGMKAWSRHSANTLS